MQFPLDGRHARGPTSGDSPHSSHPAQSSARRPAVGPCSRDAEYTSPDCLQRALRTTAPSVALTYNVGCSSSRPNRNRSNAQAHTSGTERSTGSPRRMHQPHHVANQWKLRVILDGRRSVGLSVATHIRRRVLPALTAAGYHAVAPAIRQHSR